MIPDEFFNDVTISVWPERRTHGGQYVGTTCCGVKIVHNPTGTEAISVMARSQHVNKMIAMEMIHAALTHPKASL